MAVWGSTVTGNIDDPSDVDWFLLDAQAGLLYQIDLGPEPVMDAADDPELVGIYDASGDLLPRTSNDNLSLSNLDSRVFFSSSEDGAYYVAVGSADSGSYRLSVSLISFPRTASVSEEMGEDLPANVETQEADALRQLAFAYWEAFNAYDADRALGYLEEDYRQQRDGTVRGEIERIKRFRVKLGLSEETSPWIVGHDEREMYLTMKEPLGKRRIRMAFQEVAGEWRIIFAEEAR